MPSEHRTVLDSDADDTGEHSSTDAFQTAIDDCAAAGGGTVHVPAGEYVIGPVELRDHVTLHLAAGARLLASTDPADYGTEGYPLDALVLAQDASDVAVTGRGCIDGRSDAFMRCDRDIDFDIDGHDARQGDAYLDATDEFPDGPVAPADYRPDNLILFDDCERVALDGVAIRNSPAWTLHLLDCEDVTVTGVSIDNDCRVPNSDGIVPDRSRNVRISDCAISTGDDGIVLKTTDTGDASGPCENVTVTNCTIVSRSCAIIVGGETYDDIRNCTFGNCVIRDSTRGLGVRLLDEGSIENIHFSDIVVETTLHAGNWWGQAEPIYVLAVPRTATTDVGRVDGVRFSNITATAQQGAVVFGSTESTVENLAFDGVDLRIAGGEKSEAVGGNFDIRWITDTSPPSDPDLPNVYGRDVPGVYCRHVDGLVLHDVTVEWADDGSLPDYFSHAVECEQFADVTLDRFEGRAAPGTETQSAISLHDGRTVTVRDSTAPAGTGAFLELTETADQRLFVDNDVARAERALAGDEATFDRRS
jgi:polygalacturonase